MLCVFQFSGQWVDQIGSGSAHTIRLFCYLVFTLAISKTNSDIFVFVYLFSYFGVNCWIGGRSVHTICNFPDFGFNHCHFYNKLSYSKTNEYTNIEINIKKGEIFGRTICYVPDCSGRRRELKGSN